MPGLGRPRHRGVTPPVTVPPGEGRRHMRPPAKAFDYIVVGAGSAGCVLANRLSTDPSTTVLLIEAGGRDTNPLIAVPRGFGQLLGDPGTVWHYPTRPFGPSGTSETWIRGKTLGGSSAVNGMVYNRGHRADYDELERLGNKGWGWDTMLEAFRPLRTTRSVPARRGEPGVLCGCPRRADPSSCWKTSSPPAPNSAGNARSTSTRPTRNGSATRWPRSATGAGAAPPTPSCTRWSTGRTSQWPPTRRSTGC
jgi:choline dehydrogenase-like flavoprotein